MNAVQLSWGIFTTNFYFVCFVFVPGNMSGLGILLITSSKVLYICTSKRLLDSLLFLQLHAHCSLCQEHFNNLLSGQPDPFFFPLWLILNTSTRVIFLKHYLTASHTIVKLIFSYKNITYTKLYYIFSI